MLAYKKNSKMLLGEVIDLLGASDPVCWLISSWTGGPMWAPLDFDDRHFTFWNRPSLTVA